MQNVALVEHWKKDAAAAALLTSTVRDDYVYCPVQTEFNINSIKERENDDDFFN